jgi:hypothetical protein
MSFSTPKAQLKKPENTEPVQEVDPAREADQFLEHIAQYNTFGKVLRRESLKEVGQKLAKIAEMAEVAVTNEADDWFDAHTLKRNMKEVKSYATEFMKLAEEADAINQRMSAYYDDMGRILERYFEIPDFEEVPDGKVGIEEPSELGAEEPMELTEAQPTFNGRDPAVFAATPIPPKTPDPKIIDDLTLRAIKAVYKRLKKNNPIMASKFSKLHPKKMKEVVWALCSSDKI